MEVYIIISYYHYIYIRAGTRLFNNRRLIEYLQEATRSARLGTCSVLGAAGKVEIILTSTRVKKSQHKTSTFASSYSILQTLPNHQSEEQHRASITENFVDAKAVLGKPKFNLQVFQLPYG